MAAAGYFAQFRPALLVPACALLLDQLGKERERWPLWAPALFAAGAALYFALPTEPWSFWGLFLATAALAALLALRRHPAAGIALAACLCVCAGLAAAQLRAKLVAAPVLDREIGPVPLTGTVARLEPREKGVRVILDQVAFGPELRPWAGKARLTIGRPGDVRPGDRIRTLAMLAPPGPPTVPGGFDFARQAWFQGLGAVGYALGAPVILQARAEGGPAAWLAALRNDLTARIRQAIGGEAGAVAAALMTGESGAIPEELLDAYRVSGLAHLLSISGLHMALAAGLVFFIVRGGLALVPTIALRHPIKKWAAAIALAATFAYMMIAGAPVPTQRAFVMTGLVLLGIMLDRNAISMRMVGWAALFVLALEPDALIGASFQMSFAAVIALIAAYEVMAPVLTRWRVDHGGLAGQAGFYLLGVAATTLIAGTATTVYGLYHFNRIATWSLAANLAAVPLTGFWIMPWAVLGFVLAPFGLEAWALVPMGWGIEAVDWIARAVASWPAASIPVRAMPAWGLCVFTFGGLWLCLWRARWRLAGIPIMVLGLCSIALTASPDILVDGDGGVVAVRLADGTLAFTPGKVRGFARETWLARSGQDEPAPAWPAWGRSPDGALSCDSSGCLYRAEGQFVALVRKPDALAEDCRIADLVVSLVPARRACGAGPLLVDRIDLWRDGPHAFWLSPGGIRIESVARWQGDRPWSPWWRKRRISEPDAD